MLLTVPRGGMPGGVMSLQLPPASRDTHTLPSSVPTHSRSFSYNDSSNAKIVLKISAPVSS